MSPEEALNYEVIRFKAWADANPGHFGEWEELYPDWGDLLTACDGFLAQPPERWDRASIDNLLYAIARDNECGLIVEKVTPCQLLVLSRAALDSSEWAAKWQLAVELTRLSDTPEVQTILGRFARDPHEYVRRRALLALADIHSTATEELAVEAWETGEKYQQTACLQALATVRSPLLPRYLCLAEVDAREHLREAARHLRNQQAEEGR